MKVLVFDIDGTLTATNDVDEQLFGAAIRAVFPDVPAVPFTEFTEFTDTAILREICEAYSSRDYPSVEEDVQRHFVAGLEAAVADDPGAFLPIPGACEIFTAVRDAGWAPAIATGAWRRSAELKLTAAGIPIAEVPLSTSSEAVRRVDIIRRAVECVASGEEATEVVYVGDGPWDVRACRELGIGFVGRSTPETEGLLAQEGAQATVPDFERSEDLLGLLSNSASLRP